MKHPDFRHGPISEAEMAGITAAVEGWGCEKNCFYCFLIRRNDGMENRNALRKAINKRCLEHATRMQRIAAERYGLPPVVTPTNILPMRTERVALWSTTNGQARLGELEKKKELREQANNALPTNQIVMLPTIPEEDEDQGDIEEEGRFYGYFDEPHVLAHQLLQGDSQRLHIYGRIFRGSFIPQKYLEETTKISRTESPYSLAVEEMGRLLSVYYS